MTFTEAAAEVLRLVGKPLHYKEITAYAIEKSLLSHVGKSPEVTMGSRLAALFKKQGDDNPLIRIKPGVFALKEWEESGQLKQMLSKAKPASRTISAPPQAPEMPAVEEVEPPPMSEEPVASEPAPVASEPVRASTPAPVVAQPPAPPAPFAPASSSAPAPQTDRNPQLSFSTLEAEPKASAPVPQEPEELGGFEPADEPSDVGRAESPAAAGAFDEDEDDDEQPIFGGSELPYGDREGSRRRRRRRRRARGGLEAGPGPNGGSSSIPGSYSAGPGPLEPSHPEVIIETRPLAPPAAGPHPVVLEVGSTGLDSVALDEFGGKDMADAIAVVLGSLDRAAGPVSLRQIAETAQRRGRLSGDLQQLQSQLAASVRADNLRRSAQGLRPRFRFVAGRIALTDWLLTGELPRLEAEALAAVERYRDAARKAFVRKLQELPGHAFVELVLLVLERIGFTHVRAIRRAGIPGNEAHFVALHNTGASELQTALIIRRDGREIGRERVTELRGSLHHYGPATVGWLITAGAVLSGAREEAAASNTSSIALLDGFAIAKLCEQHDVAVMRSSLPIAIPDLDVLEALRAS